MWPSTCITTMMPASMIRACTQPSATSATSTATKPETKAPTSGMNAPRNTSAASAGASGTPRIRATISTPMASTRATSTVARTYADSDCQPRERRRVDPGPGVPAASS